MWTYWYLQEGEVSLPPSTLNTDDGAESPVLHVDSHEPLVADDGATVTEEPWGIYVKPDRESVQGGAAAAAPSATSSRSTRIRRGSVEPGFPDLWCAALSHCMERFEGCRDEVRAGALGRRRRLHRRQLPRLRPHARQRLRRRRLQPRLQDDRRRARGRPRAPGRALDAAGTRSATSASPPATCTRSRRAPTRGAECRRGPRRRRGGGRARAVGRLAAGRAGRGRAGAGEGPDRLGRLGDRRRHRPQLLPLARGHRADPPVGGDVRGRARGLRLPAGRLRRRRPRGARSTTWSRSASSTRRAGYESELWSARRAAATT